MPNKGSKGEMSKQLTIAKEKFEKFQKLELEFEKKLDEYYTLTNTSAKEFRELLADQHNFSQAEWKIIQGRKQELLEPLKKMNTPGQGAVKKKNTLTKSENAQSRKLRNKLRGIKQNWIPVK